MNFFCPGGPRWQPSTASIATNITIGVASCLPLSINSSARWARCFSWPQVGTMLRWFFKYDDGNEVGQNTVELDQYVSPKAPGVWSNVLAVKSQVKGHSPFGVFLAPSGLDSTSFWSPHHFLSPDSRTSGILVTSWVQTGEVEFCGNTQAYPLPQVSSISGPFHSPVRRSFHLTRGWVIAPSGVQCLIIAVCPCVSTLKWLITNKAWCKTWCAEEYLNSPRLNLAIWLFKVWCALSTMAWPWGL